MRETPSSNLLPRTINARILSMITIGGSIGTGIFLASGQALHLAGPGGSLFAYFIVGIMVYFLMTSLAEMAAYMPVTGSFYCYATKFVDPALGYALGWNYWYSWAITVAAEIVAASLMMQYWFPHTATLFWCFAFLTLIVLFNAFSTKIFGEVEYLFALIKVMVIIIFILTGFAIILGFTQLKPVGFKFWSIGDAPFHNGWSGILTAFMIAGFSFQGTEMIGIVAGESLDPTKTIPKAIKQVFWRILLFFVLTIFVISMLIPYTSFNLLSNTVAMSPFTLIFKQFNISYLVAIMNVIILIAILSTANSGLYVATRMLWSLAKEGHAPVYFGDVNKRGVPFNALFATGLVALLAFIFSFFKQGSIYFWLLNAAGLSGLIAWLGIAICHYRFRKAYVIQGNRLEDLPYLARGYPYGSLCSFALCLFIIAGQNFQVFIDPKIAWSEVMTSYIGLPLFLCLWLGCKWHQKTRVVDLNACII